MESVVAREYQERPQGESEPAARIFVGSVSHARLGEVRHSFRYPVVFMEVDPDRGDEAQRLSGGWFGWGRWRPLSIEPKVYLPGQVQGTVKQRLQAYFERDHPEVAQAINRVRLVTAPKWLGYSFNPVSFYTCFDERGEVLAHAAEVNNTFYETHLYLLDESLRDKEVEEGEQAGGGKSGREAFSLWPRWCYRSAKAFHVSPFYDRQGEYRFTFSAPGDRLEFQVNLFRDGKPAFLASLRGNGRAATPGAYWATILSWARLSWLTYPRIVAQAAILYFRKGLPVFTKPTPSSDMTIRLDNRPGLVDRGALGAVRGHLSKIQRGVLILELPDGSVEEFRGSEAGVEAHIQVHNWVFFRRVVWAGDIGFGESYVDGEWNSRDLPAVIELFAQNVAPLNDRKILSSWVGRVANRLRHLWRPNSLKGSRRNIMAHYDLGNDFYRQWLDPSMTYSSGIYRNGECSLEEAQREKISAMIRKAGIGPEDHVLEIGCGWGGFAIEAVRQTGCRVTGLTVSEAQAQWAREKVAEAGFEDRIEIRLLDYRQIEGQFDKIVSIEMLEAVGNEYLGQYFAVCDRVLKPGGVVALQVITIPCQRFEAYRTSCDWIQKHIFPGGMLPSLTRLGEAIRDNSRFFVSHAEDIGLDYGQTLRDWRQRFLHSVQQGLHPPRLDEKFVRTWNYYLSYCEGGFRARVINTLQLVLSRPV